MTRRSKDDGQKLIAEQASSSLTIAYFCKQHNLGQSYFCKRKSELKKPVETAQNTAFLKVSRRVTNSSQSASIKIEYQKTRISLPVDIYFHRDVVDFRKSINGLIMIIEDDIKLSPFNGALLIFVTELAIS